MTTVTELKNMINKLKITGFRGVMMKDELKGEPLDTECAIINLNSSHITPEENKKTGHWISYYRREKVNYHFCSYGSPPPIALVEYLNRPVHTHFFQIQDFGETNCGELSVLFIYLMNKGLDYFDVVLNILSYK